MLKIASKKYLDTRAMCQASSKLGKGTTNLVLHARLALLLARTAGEEASPARGGGGGGGVVVMVGGVSAATSERHLDGLL